MRNCGGTAEGEERDGFGARRDTGHYDLLGGQKGNGHSRFGQDARIVLVAFFEFGRGETGDRRIGSEVLDTLRFRRAAHERRHIAVCLSSGSRG